MEISKKFRRKFKNDFVSIKEIQLFFGVSHSVIRKIIDDNKSIKFVKFSFVVRIDVDSFVKHLEQGEKKVVKSAKKKIVEFKPLPEKNPRTKTEKIADGEIAYHNLKTQ